MKRLLPWLGFRDVNDRSAVALARRLPQIPEIKPPKQCFDGDRARHQIRLVKPHRKPA